MTRLTLKNAAINAGLIFCLIAGTTNASDSTQDAWRTWSGDSVGVKNAKFFAIDHKWYGVQITCYKESDSMDSSSVEVYYQGRGLDEYKISINGRVYDSPINSEARVQSVAFNNFLDDLRTGKPITIIDGSSSATISNKNESIIPDPFGKSACFTFM